MLEVACFQHSTRHMTDNKSSVLRNIREMFSRSDQRQIWYVSLDFGEESEIDHVTYDLTMSRIIVVRFAIHSLIESSIS